MGVLTRLSDYFSYDTLWSYCSIASSYGFWILSTTIIIYYSASNVNASLNVFLYLSSMNITFSVLKYVLGIYIPSIVYFVVSSNEQLRFYLCLVFPYFARQSVRLFHK